MILMSNVCSHSKEIDTFSEIDFILNFDLQICTTPFIRSFARPEWFKEDDLGVHLAVGRNFSKAVPHNFKGKKCIKPKPISGRIALYKVSRPIWLLLKFC